MDIKEFFEQSAGKWFSQRTSHYLSNEPAKSGKSNIVIEMLSADAPEVIQLCQKYDIKPELALFGAKSRWEGTVPGLAKNQVGSTMLAIIPDSDQPNQGKVLRQFNVGQTPAESRYILGDDEVLTLITENGTTYSEERQWFGSNNLRLRTSIIQQSGQFTQAYMYSEIRMGVTQPPKKAEDAATSA